MPNGLFSAVKLDRGILRGVLVVRNDFFVFVLFKFGSVSVHGVVGGLGGFRFMPSG